MAPDGTFFLHKRESRITMRIPALLLLIVLFAVPCRAQEEEEHREQPAVSAPGLLIPTRVGNYLVGANFLFAEARLQKDIDASYNLGLTPKIGLFVLPNIALGLSVSLEFSGTDGYSSLNYGISPFVRTYFAHDNKDQPGRPLQFFVEGGVGYGGSNNRTESASGVTEVNSNGLRLYLLPGVDYFLNQHTAVELGLQYLWIGAKPSTQVLGIAIGMQIFL